MSTARKLAPSFQSPKFFYRCKKSETEIRHRCKKQIKQTKKVRTEKFHKNVHSAYNELDTSARKKN